MFVDDESALRSPKELSCGERVVLVLIRAVRVELPPQ